jgi:hypothetical protein
LHSTDRHGSRIEHVFPEFETVLARSDQIVPLRNVPPEANARAILPREQPRP